jgi:multidrug resistance efflux pump
MRKSFATIGMSLAAAAVAVAMPAFALASASPSPASVDQLAVASQQAAAPIKKAGGARRERHPEIRKAIAALERAKTDLQRANHDFGGHRAEALEACNNAIAQLKLALQYDKN